LCSKDEGRTPGGVIGGRGVEGISFTFGGGNAIEAIIATVRVLSMSASILMME
jgi:hypothetical protein